MTEATSARMRRMLESGYQYFLERLRRRLGSDAFAMEVLHETWLRIGRIGDDQLVERPEAYLFRMALNIATDRKQAETRKLSDAEIATLRHMTDGVLDPERIAEARADMALLEIALNELTPRRKEIFLLARVREMKHEDIARHFGISPRMVEKELLCALQHCSQRVNRKVIRRFGPRAQKPSKD